MKYFIISINIATVTDRHAEVLRKLAVDDYDVCIYYAASEYEYWLNRSPDAFWPKLLDVITRRDKRIEVISGGHDVSNNEPTYPNVTVHYWDTYWMYDTVTEEQVVNKIRPIEYHYVYMNHRAHPWRCYLMDLVAKHDLLKYGAVSWHTIPDPTVYTWKYFKPEIMKLSDSFAKSRYYYTLPNEYYKSFAQLVSESTTSATFMTEKTCIPLFLGKPFLVAGPPNYHKFLETLGFESYTEIFDYSFDSITDQGQRFEALLENFDKLCKLPISELTKLNKKLEKKIIRNKNLAETMGKSQSNKPQILKNIPKNIWDSHKWMWKQHAWKNDYHVIIDV